MTFTLHVDGDRWRAHAATVVAQVRAAVRGPDALPALGDVVPVAKGNGYGLGNHRLAREATLLEVARIAVGTVHEVGDVERFPGAVLVLEPYDPRDRGAALAWERVTAQDGARVLRTVADVGALLAVIAAGSPPVRVVLEAAGSMTRFGLPADVLAAALARPEVLAALRSGQLVLEGLALHLPLALPEGWPVGAPALLGEPEAGGAGARVAEALAWGLEWSALVEDLVTRAPDLAGDLVAARALWVSHLDDDELAALRSGLPAGTALLPRIGTRLWLGDRAALTARGTVLAVHRVDRGRTVGYRQRRARTKGWVVVVSGGTAHGVGLAAPSAVASWRQRAGAASGGALEALGRVRAPFRAGRRRTWFVEPPHMQVSMLWLPARTSVPVVGEEWACDVRFTTLAPDRVVGLD